MRGWLNAVIPALIIGIGATLFASVKDITMLKTEDISIQRELQELKAGQARIMQFLLNLKKD